MHKHIYPSPLLRLFLIIPSFLVFPSSPHALFPSRGCCHNSPWAQGGGVIPSDRRRGKQRLIRYRLLIPSRISWRCCSCFRALVITTHSFFRLPLPQRYLHPQKQTHALRHAHIISIVLCFYFFSHPLLATIVPISFSHFVSVYINSVIFRTSLLSLYALLSRFSSFPCLHSIFVFLPVVSLSFLLFPLLLNFSSLFCLSFPLTSSFLCNCFLASLFSCLSSVTAIPFSAMPLLNPSPFPLHPLCHLLSLSSDVRVYPTPSPVNRYLFKHQTSCR